MIDNPPGNSHNLHFSAFKHFVALTPDLDEYLLWDPDEEVMYFTKWDIFKVINICRE